MILGTSFPDLYPRETPFRILIVDDVVENVDVISDCLTLEGYETLTAFNGPEALEIWEKESPDLILLDVMMPEMSGIEVLKTIREKQAPDDYLPVLLVTALQDLRSKTEGLEAGAEDFIPKPFEPQELIARVRSHLRAKSFHDRMARANGALRDERERIALMQRNLLPGSLPREERMNVAARYIACDRIGGDFYDAFRISPSTYGFVVADVSGHGAPSAVVMSAVKALIHTRPAEFEDPGDTLAWLNKSLTRIVKTEDFVTMFFGVLDLESATFRYASAGHHPSLLTRKGLEKPTLLQNHSGFPLAVAPDNPIDSQSIDLQPGDRLILYTDGIPEAVNAKREMYGCDKFRTAVMRLAQRVPDLEAFADAILSDLRAFSRGVPLRDDITLLCIEYSGRPMESNRPETDSALAANPQI